LFLGKTVEEILNPIQRRLPATNLNITPVPKISIFVTQLTQHSVNYSTQVDKVQRY